MNFNWAIITKNGNTWTIDKFRTKKQLEMHAEMNGLKLVRLNKFEFEVIA